MQPGKMRAWLGVVVCTCPLWHYLLPPQTQHPISLQCREREPGAHQTPQFRMDKAESGVCSAKCGKYIHNARTMVRSQPDNQCAKSRPCKSLGGKGEGDFHRRDVASVPDAEAN